MVKNKFSRAHNPKVRGSNPLPAATKQVRSKDYNFAVKKMRDDEAVQALLLAGENHEHPAADTCFFSVQAPVHSFRNRIAKQSGIRGFFLKPFPLKS